MINGQLEEQRVLRDWDERFGKRGAKKWLSGLRSAGSATHAHKLTAREARAGLQWDISVAVCRVVDLGLKNTFAETSSRDLYATHVCIQTQARVRVGMHIRKRTGRYRACSARGWRCAALKFGASARGQVV